MKLLYEANKHLIIQLIMQDMKHEQLINKLSAIGFRKDKYNQDSSGIISELMGVPEIEMSWDWYTLYVSCLKEASHYEATEDEKILQSLAEKSYKLLMLCIEEEQ